MVGTVFPSHPIKWGMGEFRQLSYSVVRASQIIF